MSLVPPMIHTVISFYVPTLVSVLNTCLHCLPSCPEGTCEQEYLNNCSSQAREISFSGDPKVKMACSLGLLTLPQPKTTTEVTKQEALAYEGNEWSTGQQVGGKGEMWKSLHRPSRGRCGYAHGRHPQPFPVSPECSRGRCHISFSLKIVV